MRESFQIVANTSPTAVIPVSADGRDAVYALICEIFRIQRLNDFFNELGSRSAALRAEIDNLLGLNQICPTQELMIDDSLPFIDKKSLRTTLSNLIARDLNRSRVVVIDGPTPSGKSHSLHLVSHVGRQRGGAKIVWTKLTDIHASFDFEPLDLMESIANQLGMDIADSVRKTRAQDARITLKLIDWFVGEFGTYADPFQPVWLLIDDLGSVGCPQWIFDFVAYLVTRCARGQLVGLKTFLIGLDPMRLDSTGRYFCTRDHATAFTPDDIWDFLVEGGARKGKFLPADQKANILANVWGTPPVALRHEDLAEIAEKAAAFLETL